jgi:hypothetical protein
MQNKHRLTYSNVVSTLALFLALGGGAAYAADKIHSGDIAPGAVRTSDVFKRAITSGKLGVGAVRSNQIAAGAVGPANLAFPVSFVASPSGGAAPVSNEPKPYPLTDNSWGQKSGEINVVFGAATGTIAYDGSGQGSCRVYFELNLNGLQVGGGELGTDSTTALKVEQSLGAQPQIDPLTPITNQLTIKTTSNGACTSGSTIDSTRFRVVDFG